MRRIVMMMVVEAVLRVVGRSCCRGMQAHSHAVHVLVHLVVEGSGVLEVETRLRLRLDVEGVEGERVLWVAALLMVMVVMVHARGRGDDLVALLGQLAVLGTAVLEPDLHLALRQVQRVRQLGLSADRDVSRGVVLLLQLHPLKVRVDDAVLVFSPCFAWRVEEGRRGNRYLVFS